MIWYRNNKTYFFSGDYYWRYDNNLKRFDKGYPRVTANVWKGAPKHIDAAFSSEKETKTFFISGNQIYMLDDE